MQTRIIDQGTIIYGIRSKKYSTTPCYGIIITARCDIAQRKVPKYYYLVAVDVVSWFKSAHGYEQAYRNYITQKLEDVVKRANKVELDGNTLAKMDDPELNIILDNSLSLHPENKKYIDSLRKALNEYHIFNRVNMDDNARADAIKHRNKDAINCLKRISQGDFHHYYFLPQDAYLNNGIKDEGIIVDLLEIDSLPVSDAKRLTEPYEKSIILDNIPKLPDTEELAEIVKDDNKFLLETTMQQIAEHFRLMNSYWLIDESSFVDIEGTTKSPWCEHLMQRFSNAFIRIGLDNPTENHIKMIIGRIEKGRNQ